MELLRYAYYMKRRKQYFLLMEALVALFSGVLLRGPWGVFQNNLTELRELEFERVFALSYVEVIEKCYQDKWHQLLLEQEIDLEKLPLLIPGYPNMQVTRTVRKEKSKDGEKEDGTIYNKTIFLITLQSGSLTKSGRFSIFKERPAPKSS